MKAHEGDSINTRHIQHLEAPEGDVERVVFLREYCKALDVFGGGFVVGTVLASSEQQTCETLTHHTHTLLLMSKREFSLSSLQGTGANRAILGALDTAWMLKAYFAQRKDELAVQRQATERRRGESVCLCCFLFFGRCVEVSVHTTVCFLKDLDGTRRKPGIHALYNSR